MIILSRSGVKPPFYHSYPTQYIQTTISEDTHKKTLHKTQREKECVACGGKKGSVRERARVEKYLRRGAPVALSGMLTWIHARMGNNRHLSMSTAATLRPTKSLQHCCYWVPESYLGPIACTVCACLCAMEIENAIKMEWDPKNKDLRPDFYIGLQYTVWALMLLCLPCKYVHVWTNAKQALFPFTSTCLDCSLFKSLPRHSNRKVLLILGKAVIWVDAGGGSWTWKTKKRGQLFPSTICNHVSVMWRFHSGCN